MPKNAQSQIDDFMERWRKDPQSADRQALRPDYLSSGEDAATATLSDDEVPPAVAEWRMAGDFVKVGGHDVFLVDRRIEGKPTIVILHGFPGSSWDFRPLVEQLSGHVGIVAFDFPGYGLSSKPLDGDYSLENMANLTEALLAQLDVKRCALYGWDIGSTLTAELLMRRTESALSFDVEEIFLTNGIIFMDLGRFAPGLLALLSLPDEALTERLPLEQFLPQIRALFSREHPPSAEDEACLLWLMRHQEGDRLLPRLVRYVEERRAQQERWTKGLLSYKGPMTVMWGEQDPGGVVAVAQHLKEIRPETDLLTWADVGHLPHFEVPDRVAKEILQRVASRD